MQIKTNRKGFTLLEILLVIAAIGILAAIVLVAINPNKQLAQARDTARQSDINTLQKALDQYLIETRAYPASVSSTPGYICNTGTEQVGGGTNCSGRIDLRVLVPNYIAAIPRDTQVTGNSTGYNIVINPNNNKIAIQADFAERKSISINPYIVTSGLVLNLDAGNTASYPGTGTTWTDLSGNGNNGTLINGVGYNAVNGGSLVFDGVDDRVLSTNNPSLQITTGTISAWFKATNLNSGYRGVIAKQGAWGLFLRDNIFVTYDWGNNLERSTGINVGNNTWSYIVMSFTETVGTPSNNALIYLNGNLVLTTTIRHSNHAATLQIGEANANQFFNGNISQTLVYNRVLSPAEIQQNYNALRGRYGL